MGRYAGLQVCKKEIAIGAGNKLWCISGSFKTGVALAVTVLSYIILSRALSDLFRAYHQNAYIALATTVISSASVENGRENHLEKGKSCDDGGAHSYRPKLGVRGIDLF